MANIADNANLSNALLLSDDKQDFSRYNYEAMQHWYAALANREYAPATIHFLGDSGVTGAYASSASKTFTRIFTDGIQRMYRTGGRGWLPVFTHMTEGVGSGGTLIATTGIGKILYAMTGNSQTYTYTLTGDRFWLIFTGLTNTGNAEISIDGAAFQTFSTTASDNTGQKKKFDSGQLATTVSGTHTVVVRGAAVGNGIWLDGLFEFNTDYGKGVQVWPTGHAGAVAGDFTDPLIDHYKAMAADIINPDLVFIQFALNDLANGVPKATYKANLAAIISNYRTLSATPPSIVLMGFWARGDGSYTDAQFQPYRLAMRELSVEQGVVFFDMYDFGGWMGATGSMSVNDLVINGTTTVTSATALFRTFDVGTSITGPGIPNGTTIASTPATQGVPSTTAVLSAAATASGTITANFPSRKDPNLLTTDQLHPSDRGQQWVADGLMRLTAGLPKLANIPQGLADAQGDIPVATGADNFGKLSGPDALEGQTLHKGGSSGVGMVFKDPGVGARLMRASVTANSTTLNNVGLAALPTTSGTSATFTASDQVDGPFVAMATQSLINNDAIYGANILTIVRPAWLPEVEFIGRTHSAITNQRVWIGLASATPMASTDPAVHFAGFYYDSAGSAFWRAYTNDGTSTGTPTVTTVPVAVSTRYRFRVVAFSNTPGTNPTVWRFYINDNLVAIHTTNLPGGSSNNLGPLVGVRNLSVGVQTFLFGGWGMSHV